MATYHELIDDGPGFETSHGVFASAAEAEAEAERQGLPSFIIEPAEIDADTPAGRTLQRVLAS